MNILLVRGLVGLVGFHHGSPGHDYHGKESSTIGNEKKFNPRLQVKNVDEYVELMSNLNLAKPQLIDINVSRNIKLGAN